MHEKDAQFVFLKIPPNSVRLLGKIHTLSIGILQYRSLIKALRPKKYLCVGMSEIVFIYLFILFFFLSAFYLFQNGDKNCRVGPKR